MGETLTSDPGLEILRKTNALVRSFQDQGEMTAAQLAERVGEPVSSTYRLLTSLTGLGLVDAGSRRGLFRLGVYFLRIGSELEDRVSAREAATPVLGKLLSDTGATSFLLIRSGARAVCIERLEGNQVRSLALALGGSLPLYQGAAPTAIFAFLADHEREALLDSFENDALTDKTVPLRATIKATAREVRRNGFAISDGDVTHGIASIGAPIFNHRGELAGAISISGLRAHILDSSSKFVDIVLSAANDASKNLGWSEEGVARQ